MKETTVKVFCDLCKTEIVVRTGANELHPEAVSKVVVNVYYGTGVVVNDICTTCSDAIIKTLHSLKVTKAWGR